MTKSVSSTESKAFHRNARINTMLKFSRSAETGTIVGFVSQHPKHGRIVGVREDSEYPKKICLIDKDLVGTIITGILYKCEIIPMTPQNGHIPGYIVVKAKPKQFKAKVVTDYRHRKQYRVTVFFGNMKVTYDPYRGQKASVWDVAECRKFLEHRVDILNLMDVLEEFDKAAFSISEKLGEDFTENELKRSRWRRDHR